MRNEKGLILMQVLMLALLVCLICVAMARLRLQPSATAAGFVDDATRDLSAQAALNRLDEVWARSGVCSSDFASGVACSGHGCRCSCDVRGVAVESVPNGVSCALSLAP